MDRDTVVYKLNKFYAIENRNTRLSDVDTYIANHVDAILKRSNGVWNDDITEEYMNKLEASL